MSEHTELDRYGIAWDGPTNPICQLMVDGLWTPWHLADAGITRLRAERDALAKDAARYRWLRDRAVRNTAEGRQVWCVIGEGAPDAHPIDLDELDVAVDAALAEEARTRGKT